MLCSHVLFDKNIESLSKSDLKNMFNPNLGQIDVGDNVIMLTQCHQLSPFQVLDLLNGDVLGFVSMGFFTNASWFSSDVS